MIICVCNGISDREIKLMIEAGANSVRDIQAQTLAGTCCGICLSELKECLQKEVQHKIGSGTGQKSRET